MLRRAGSLLREKPLSLLLGIRSCAFRRFVSSDHGRRRKLRHSTRMYEQQQEIRYAMGAGVTGEGGQQQQQQQQVVIPGLSLLAAAQAQARVDGQLQTDRVVLQTTTATEFIPSNQATIPSAPIRTGYIPPKQKKRQKKAAAAAAAAAAASATRTPPTPSSPPDADKRSRDTITAPSAASGGVPDPSPSYLALSSPQASTLSQSRRILVIMDLNGTLLHRPSKKRPFHFVERPHAKRFLQYCLDNFLVAIWSSARPRNVENMVRQLLTPDQVNRLLVTWARDKFGLTPEDYNARVQVYKRLTTVWAEPGVQAAHPDFHAGGRWDQTNTVLVDDSVEKGRSEPHNILVLPEFAGVGFETADVLPQVHDYLNTLCWQANVSSYMRENPFSLDDAYTLGGGRR